MAKDAFDIMNMTIEDIKRNLNDYSWTFYGVGGFGKSQVVAFLFDDPAFWQWEQGQNAIKAKKVPCGSWKQAKDHLKKLQQAFKDGKPMPFKTAIMDTADVAWVRCQKSVCDLNGWEDPSDGEWGKGHNKVKEEWDLFMGDLEAIGIKVVFISHDKDKEIKPKRGEKYQEIQPSVPAGCQATIYDKVDFCVYCSADKDADGGLSNRQMNFRSNGDFRAKSRLMYMPETMDYGVLPIDASVRIRNAFDEAIIKEFGSEDGTVPPLGGTPAKADKKKTTNASKATDTKKDKVETKPEVKEEKEVVKQEETPATTTPEDKVVETETPASETPTNEPEKTNEPLTLETMKEAIEKFFKAEIKAKRLTAPQVVKKVKDFTDVNRIGEIADYEKCLKLFNDLFTEPEPDPEI